MPIFPKMQKKGSAPTCPEGTVDIVDEAINYFKANVFFNTYEIKGDQDRTLLYLTLYTHQCLTRMTRATSKDAVLREMYQLSIETFKLPMDAGFPIASFYSQCGSKREQDELRQYLLHLRQELGLRLAEIVCATADGKPSKWWLCFTKRRFLGKSLEGPGAHARK